jgi:uncharacterized membrane protein YjjB (DUF3815 family)
MIENIIYCTIGSVAFAITMRAPKQNLKYIAIGAIISSSIDEILREYYGEFTSCLMAMICLSLFCELMARIIKQPTTVLLIPSVIPLLPGSAIYYAMLYAIQSNNQLFATYAKKTLSIGLAIALGAVVSSTVIKMLNIYRGH